MLAFWRTSIKYRYGPKLLCICTYARKSCLARGKGNTVFMHQHALEISTLGPEVIKLFSCSTQLSMKFFNAHKYKKYQAIQLFSDSDKPRMLFSVLINVKMPTIVGILTFMGRKNFMLNWVEHEKSFITSGPGFLMEHILWQHRCRSCHRKCMPKLPRIKSFDTETT